MTPVGPVNAVTRVDAPRVVVWEFLEQQELRSSWWPEVRIDCSTGGSVAEHWSEGTGDSAVERNASGAIDVLVRGHALGFRWQDAADAHPTEVLITLRSYDDETGVIVSETGFGRFADAAERAADAQESWGELLEALARAVADPELCAQAEASVCAPRQAPRQAPESVESVPALPEPAVVVPVPGETVSEPEGVPETVPVPGGTAPEQPAVSVQPSASAPSQVPVQPSVESAQPSLPDSAAEDAFEARAESSDADADDADLASNTAVSEVDQAVSGSAETVLDAVRADSGEEPVHSADADVTSVPDPEPEPAVEPALDTDPEPESDSGPGLDPDLEHEAIEPATEVAGSESDVADAADSGTDDGAAATGVRLPGPGPAGGAEELLDFDEFIRTAFGRERN